VKHKRERLVLIDEDELEQIIEENVMRATEHTLKRLQLEELVARLYLLKEWLTLVETAAYLGVKPETVRTSYMKRGLRPAAPSKMLYFKRTEIDDWLERSRLAGG
jgi:hypothetical protein